SCWTFSTAATIEGLHKLTTGQLINLSEQQILDCDTGGRDLGCRGGFSESAYQFVIRNGGLTTYNNYPYVGYQQRCRRGLPAAARIGGYQNVPSNNEQALVQALAHQPVAVVIDAQSYQLKHYQGGVFRGPCGTSLNHLVTAVGYGVARDGTPVWLIKNSWGTAWGQGGYLLLQRNINDARGRCGVAMRPAYPTN
ncbi:Senescence-specific cysteine protease SAG39-like protein, partial [Drosera capensis]